MYIKITLPQHGEQGLTLIELIMAIIIISVGVIGILAVMNVTVKSSADPLLYKQACAMAEAVMEEISAKDYTNPLDGFVETSPTNCAGRLFYDDIDDYNCFDGSTATKVILSNMTLSGISSGLQNYTATISVTPVTINAITMKRINVTVTGSGITVGLNGYRSNY